MITKDHNLLQCFTACTLSHALGVYFFFFFFFFSYRARAGLWILFLCSSPSPAVACSPFSLPSPFLVPPCLHWSRLTVKSVKKGKPFPGCCSPLPASILPLPFNRCFPLLQLPSLLSPSCPFCPLLHFPFPQVCRHFYRSSALFVLRQMTAGPFPAVILQASRKR
jgi:hypothetical protein